MRMLVFNKYTSGRYGLAEVPENMFSAFYGLYTSVWGHSGGENNWDAPQEGFETKHSYTQQIVVAIVSGVWALAAIQFVRTPQIKAICSKTPCS